MVAGYLLWVGAHAPGGAFQGGSVLGAAGVLLLLVGWRLGTRFVGLPLRITLVFGVGIFVSAGVVFILLGRQFLEYPPSFAGVLILLIEAAATLSIGITLAALFLGGRPEFRRHK
jgi:multisubunit Na+/H+ antiporter MnhB subunit